jgi:hypothetical protein
MNKIEIEKILKSFFIHRGPGMVGKDKKSWNISSKTAVLFGINILKCCNYKS